MAVIAKDAALQIERLTLGPWGTNAYIVVCLKTQSSVLIDAPAEADTIMEKLQGTRCRYILMTHDHPDHTGALTELHSRLKIPLAAHTSDSENLPDKPDILLNDGDKIFVGELGFEVLHTPGHTPGSLCFRVGRYLLSGDTIFTGGPGRTRRPADLKQILESIARKIIVLPDDTLIYPGHGDSTVLKKEREELAVFSSRSHDPNLSGDIVWLSS
jgi:hydroxyacylglutathione hydrolase